MNATQPVAAIRILAVLVFGFSFYDVASHIGEIGSITVTVFTREHSLSLGILLLNAGSVIIDGGVSGVRKLTRYVGSSRAAEPLTFRILPEAVAQDMQADLHELHRQGSKWFWFRCSCLWLLDRLWVLARVRR